MIVSRTKRGGHEREPRRSEWATGLRAFCPDCRFEFRAQTRGKSPSDQRQVKRVFGEHVYHHVMATGHRAPVYPEPKLTLRCMACRFPAGWHSRQGQASREFLMHACSDLVLTVMLAVRRSTDEILGGST